MWLIVIAMLVILLCAGLVVLYVAFPHRGEELPAAPWLGDAMRRGVEAAPTIDNTATESPGGGILPGDATPHEPGAHADR